MNKQQLIAYIEKTIYMETIRFIDEDEYVLIYRHKRADKFRLSELLRLINEHNQGRNYQAGMESIYENG